MIDQALFYSLGRHIFLPWPDLHSPQQLIWSPAWCLSWPLLELPKISIFVDKLNDFFRFESKTNLDCLGQKFFQWKVREKGRGVGHDGYLGLNPRYLNSRYAQLLNSKYFWSIFFCVWYDLMIPAVLTLPGWFHWLLLPAKSLSSWPKSAF